MTVEPWKKIANAALWVAETAISIVLLPFDLWAKAEAKLKRKRDDATDDK